MTPVDLDDRLLPTIALDPFMHRRLPIGDVVRLAADLGYRHLEWSWRDDFIPLFRHPRADAARIAELRQALVSTGVELASLVVLYRWSSPDEAVRTDAIRSFRRAIEIARDLGCRRMNTEFSGAPETPDSCEAAWRRSLDEVLPQLEVDGIVLDIEPHPGDFVEDNTGGVDLVRSVDSDNLRYLFCAPHIFHLGDDPAAMIRYAAPVLGHVHLADTMDHRASSGLRFIVNPLGAPVRVHQHLPIGEGEVPWDAVFGALHAIGFAGILTSAVFSREEVALDASRRMLEAIADGLERARGSDA